MREKYASSPEFRQMMSAAELRRRENDRAKFNASRRQHYRRHAKKIIARTSAYYYRCKLQEAA